MSDETSAAVGNTGSAASFEFLGEVYALHKLTDKLRAKYTSWIHREVIRRLFECRDAYKPEEFTEQTRLLQRDISLGQYAFGTPASVTIGNTREGNIAFFRVLFDDPRVNEALVKQMFEARADELQTVYDTLHGTGGKTETEDHSPNE